MLWGRWRAEGTWERSAARLAVSVAYLNAPMQYLIRTSISWVITNLNDSNLMLWLASIQTLAVGINFKYYCFVAMAD